MLNSTLQPLLVSPLQPTGTYLRASKPGSPAYYHWSPDSNQVIIWKGELILPTMLKVLSHA